MSKLPRFIVVTYAAQGHINPSLQLSKCLAAVGADITFVTAVYAHRRMSNGTSSASFPNGGRITYAPFSDGYDDGFKPGDDVDNYLSEFSRRGSQAVSDLVAAAVRDGRPYTCLVYTILIPWAGLIAHELRLPSVQLWIQPATVFDIYYYYFHGYGDILCTSATAAKIALPGLSLQLSSSDLPSFMDATNTYSFAIPLLRDQFKLLDETTIKVPKVLVNTFDALEPEGLRAVRDDVINLVGIGPLIPSAFLDEKDPSDTCFGGDLFQRAKDDRCIIEWLNTKQKGSVIYVSFGTICVLSKPQMEEIAKGLLDSGRPFLWVITEKAIKGEDTEKEEESILSFQQELEKQGLIVPWCRQVEVLSNEALGCFMTHCGWNSTLESMVAGVPVVAVPQWTDQRTNAKLVEDVWKVGVRVKIGDDGIVGSGEIKRCVELVMEGEEFRRNAKKWKGLAREAAKEGGSSDRNLMAFVAEMVGESRNVQSCFCIH